MSYLKILIPALILVISFSCSKEAIIPDFSDCWKEIESEEVLQFAGANYTFCFLNDTELTIEITRWTDVIEIDGPNCQSNTNYIKGTYTWTNESLETLGIYTTSDFSTPDSICNGQTEFERNYTMEVVSETEVILDKNENSSVLGIRLIKR